MTQRLVPIVTDETAFYWEGAARGELLLQRCTACGTLRHPPGPCCPQCRSLSWVPVAAAGCGVVYSFVRLHPPTVPGIEPGTVVAVVELDEGVRVVTNIVDTAADAVRVGMPVELCFEALDATIALPQFRAAERAGA